MTVNSRSRALRTCLAALGFVACTATNDALFDPDMTRDPLVPLPSVGMVGGAATPNVTDPAPAANTGGSGAVGDGGGTGMTAGPTRPAPRPAAPDAGATPLEGGDAGAPPDVPGADDGSCGEQCGRSGGLCGAGTCFFDCRANNSCRNRQLICPPGVPCDVTCGDGACTDNVLCSVGSICNIRCEGQNSCDEEVICEGQCEVTCSGARSCAGGIGGAAQLLDLKCTGTQSCGATVQCEGQDCRVSCSGAQSCERVSIFANSNTLSCTGQDSCRRDVSCNGGRCSAECAQGACENGVDCDALTCSISRDATAD